MTVSFAERDSKYATKKVTGETITISAPALD